MLMIETREKQAARLFSKRLEEIHAMRRVEIKALIDDCRIEKTYKMVNRAIIIACALYVILFGVYLMTGGMVK